MKALRKVGPTKQGVVVQEVPEPRGCKADEILVKAMCVGICGSDLHIWKDEKEHKQPVTLGHEYSGKVIQIGERCERIEVGDRICGDLETLDGRIGTHVDGACAEYLVIPEALAHKLPNTVSYEEGAMVELVTCMAHDLMFRSRINPADFVVILGPGPIGLTLTQLVRLWSPRFVMTTGLSVDGLRLDMATKLGADLVYRSEDNPVEKVLELTKGRGADFIVDATGGHDAITQATRMARTGAWITVVGLWERTLKSTSMLFHTRA